MYINNKNSFIIITTDKYIILILYITKQDIYMEII